MRRKWFDILFSFSGRIDREHFWFGHLLALAIALTIGVLGVFVMALFADSPKSAALAIVILLPAYSWMNLALMMKRLHDVNMSGAWVFAGIVPYIGGLWLLAVTGFKRGDESTNRYGKPNSWPRKLTSNERLRKKAQRVKRRAVVSSAS